MAAPSQPTGWQMPTPTKRTTPPVQPTTTGGVSTLSSLYPQVLPDGANVPMVSARAGFSQAAARKAALAKDMQQQSTQQPIPPTVDYPESTLLAQQGQAHRPHHAATTHHPVASPAAASGRPPTATSGIGVPSARSASMQLGVPGGSAATQPIVPMRGSSTLGISVGPGTIAASPSVISSSSFLAGGGIGASSFTNPSILAATSASRHQQTFGAGAAIGFAAATAAVVAGTGPLATTNASSAYSVPLGNPLAASLATVGGVGHALQLQAQQLPAPPQQQKVSLDVGQPLNALTCSPDRTHLAVGGKDVKIIAHTNGKFIPVKHLNTNSKTPTALSDIQWHPLEAFKYWLVTAPTNGKIVLYNLNSKEGLKRSERILDDHERTVTRIVWHPNQGEILFSGSQDGTVKMFDLRSPLDKAVQCFSDVHSVRDVQVNPFNHNIFASASDNGSMQIWDVRKGQYFHTINAHQGLILTLDWHPEDKDILASGGVDRNIKVWHIGASVDKCMSTIHSTPAGGHHSALSAGNLVSAGSPSSTNQSEPLHVIQTIASVGRVKWRPSRKYHFQIASVAGLMDTKIHIWNVHRPFVPLVSLLGHRDVISGFYFSDADSQGNLCGDEIISCSKDSTIQQNFLYIDHALNPSYHLTSYPHEQLSTASIAWNVQGSIATANDFIDRTNKIRQADPTIAAAPFAFTAYNPVLLSSATVAGTQLKPNSIQSAVLASILGANANVEALRNGFIRIFNGSTPNLHAAPDHDQPHHANGVDPTVAPPHHHQLMLSDEEAFIHFARNYKFTANAAFSSITTCASHTDSAAHANFVTLAQHNSDVARAAMQFEVSQIWLVLIQLLGPGERRKEVEATGPPPLPMDEHSIQAKLKADAQTSASATLVPSTTYVPAQSHNPSTVLHHRHSSSGASPDGRDDLASQYLQVQLIDSSLPDLASPNSQRTEQKEESAVASITKSASSGSLPPSSPRVPDPTQTISALNRSHILVDCLPTIHKSHCYTLQAPASSSLAPSPPLPNPYNGGLSILSSSSFQATLLNSFLESSIERGDVQTCVAVVSLLKEFHPGVIVAMEEAERARELTSAGALGHTITDRFKHWYYSYIDLLQRHELYSHASEIIQLCNDDDLKKLNQKSTTIALICPVCKHSSQQVGVGCTSKMCTRTRMTNCSICHTTVQGVFVWCQGCGHGGHMAHMQAWFGKHSFCPTGCLHRCVELLTGNER